MFTMKAEATKNKTIKQYNRKGHYKTKSIIRRIIFGVVYVHMIHLVLYFNSGRQTMFPWNNDIQLTGLRSSVLKS